MDSVFIFQSSAEETTNTSFDAIVVEQWTVVDVGLWVFNSLDVHFEKSVVTEGLSCFLSNIT